MSDLCLGININKRYITKSHMEMLLVYISQLAEECSILGSIQSSGVSRFYHWIYTSPTQNQITTL